MNPIIRSESSSSEIFNLEPAELIGRSKPDAAKDECTPSSQPRNFLWYRDNLVKIMQPLQGCQRVAEQLNCIKKWPEVTATPELTKWKKKCTSLCREISEECRENPPLLEECLKTFTEIGRWYLEFNKFEKLPSDELSSDFGEVENIFWDEQQDSNVSLYRFFCEGMYLASKNRIDRAYSNLNEINRLKFTNREDCKNKKLFTAYMMRLISEKIISQQIHEFRPMSGSEKK